AVIERRHLAAGATGRSSGLVRMHYDLEAEARLAWESFQWFRDWNERVGPDPCGFTRTGFLQLVEREHVDALKANTAMLQRLGVPAMLVAADDVKRLAPAFVTDDFDLAAYEPESGYADPVSTAAALMNAARRRGAVLVQDCAVTGIRVRAGKVTGVDTTQGVFSAPIVVNAAGAWARRICEMAGVEVPIGTWRHDVMFVARPPELRLSWSAADSTPRTAATTASRQISIPPSGRSAPRASGSTAGSAARDSRSRPPSVSASPNGFSTARPKRWTSPPSRRRASRRESASSAGIPTKASGDRLDFCCDSHAEKCYTDNVVSA
ncbi:MAG: hypothetical protein DCC54_11080, partial [Anaerolineae bacterium]